MVHRETITDHLDSADSSILEGGLRGRTDDDILDDSRSVTPHFKFLPALTQQSSFKLDSINKDNQEIASV